MRGGADATAGARLRVMLIIWAAFLSTCFIYSGVLFIVTDTQDSGAQGGLDLWAVPFPNPVLAGAFVLMALSCSAMCLILPPIVWRMQQVPLVDPYARLLQSVILRCALTEPIALFGLVGGITGCFALAHSLAAIGVAAVFIAFLLPWILSSHEKIRRGAQQREGGQL